MLVHTDGIGSHRAFLLSAGACSVLEPSAVVRKVLEGVKIGHRRRVVFECQIALIVTVRLGAASRHDLGGTLSGKLVHCLLLLVASADAYARVEQFFLLA